MIKHKNKKSFKTIWKKWGYKNTFFLIISIIALIFITQTPLLDIIVKHIGYLDYFGAFLTGILMVSTFTVAPATVILFHIASYLDTYIVVLFASLGSVIGDFIVFRFVKDRVVSEWQLFFKRLHFPKLKKIFQTPYFAWLVPLIGAVLIASPLPDEIGISLLGASKINHRSFLILTFILNLIGIFIIVSVAQLLS